MQNKVKNKLTSKDNFKWCRVNLFSYMKCEDKINRFLKSKEGKKITKVGFTIPRLFEK